MIEEYTTWREANPNAVCGIPKRVHEKKKQTANVRKCPYCERPLEEHEQDTPKGNMKVYLCEKVTIPIICSQTEGSYMLRRQNK